MNFGKLKLFFAVVLTCTAIVYANDPNSTVELWSRGDKCYLVSNASMPIWPRIPNNAFDSNEPLTMTITMPAGFKISAIGDDDSFALQPKPLIVPEKVDYVQKDQQVIYTLQLPAKTKEKKDHLTYKEQDRCVRAAIMINPGQTKPGCYPIVITLKKKDSSRTWKDLNATAIVLDELKGRSPKRMRVELYTYDGYKPGDFRTELVNTIVRSGTNNISTVRVETQDESFTQDLRHRGIKANLLAFWHRIGMELSQDVPEVLTLGPDGKPQQITDSWPVDVSICHTWFIQNREKARQALVKYLKQTLVGKYDGLINDNEEKAFTRDEKEIKGDLYTPATLDLFRKMSAIPADQKLTPEIITRDYAAKWVDFRCWQSAQMSAILSEALAEVDPELSYGYYSGHKYVGKLAGFTRSMYATDWDLLAKEGGLQFGASGYYGSTEDYAATTAALGISNIPHVPAEMFIENFLDFSREMPEPNEFAYRLMNSLMYGSGGFGVWYVQVLDGAAFSAISRVADIAAETEDFLMDGSRCESKLAIPSTIDKKAVFAYELGAKRLVVVINHSAKPKDIKLSWKEPITKPDTVELVSGRNLAASKVMDAKLGPKAFAVFITLSEGN